VLRRLLAATAAITAGATRPAAAAPLPLLDETDPVAVSLGYVANAKRVDRRKYPAYDGRQTCASCALIAFGTAVRRPCTLFPGKVVLATGWCRSWQPKGRKA